MQKVNNVNVYQKLARKKGKMFNLWLMALSCVSQLKEYSPSKVRLGLSFERVFILI
jgi:hypothetical protein